MLPIVETLIAQIAENLFALIFGHSWK